MGLQLLQEMNGKVCACGKCHSFGTQVVSGKGVLNGLGDILAQFSPKKVFVLADQNTYKAAGEQVCRILGEEKIPYVSYILPWEKPEPDEHSVGAAVMHFDGNCDVVIAVGSGVVNDIGKMLSAVAGTPYVIVATAPSMDGYASATSSMTRDGLKVSINTKAADVIVGDTEILCKAPLHLMRSGLGDMLAKYVSICEWRISHLITGEYYCEEVARLVRQALKRCVDNSRGLLNRDEAAVEAVFEGLVIGGVAMNYAGLSRPASGVEHYISHVLDMRGVEFHTPVELHGIQCAVGTCLAVSMYEKLKKCQPDRERALMHAQEFDYGVWCDGLRRFLGKGAESMIALEEKEGKYDLSQHEKRLNIILKYWPEILSIMEQELPSLKELEALLDDMGIPKTLEELGTPEEYFPVILAATRDIRDKYVLSRLMWDLGL